MLKYKYIISTVHLCLGHKKFCGNCDYESCSKIFPFWLLFSIEISQLKISLRSTFRLSSVQIICFIAMCVPAVQNRLCCRVLLQLWKIFNRSTLHQFSYSIKILVCYFLFAYNYCFLSFASFYTVVFHFLPKTLCQKQFVILYWKKEKQS